METERVHERRNADGSVAFRFAQVKGTGDSDHASWWSFSDEQELRDRWWKPRRGETVLDIGAAFGSYALPALAAGARVVCFSPAAFDTKLLKINLGLNPDLARRCLVIRGGLYSQDGYFDPDRCAFAVAAPFRVGPPIPGREVEEAICETTKHQWLPVRSLDSVLEERPGIEAVSWMKIDVEGAELEVLKGARKCLEMYRPRILVENHEFQKPGIASSVRDFLLGLGLGYRCDGPYQHCAVSHSFFEAPRVA